MQKLVRMFSSWETKRMVLPQRRSSSILRKHFAWKLASPTASASSMMRISRRRVETRGQADFMRSSRYEEFAMKLRSSLNSMME